MGFSGDNVYLFIQPSTLRLDLDLRAMQSKLAWMRMQWLDVHFGGVFVGLGALFLGQGAQS